jgi:hypothetical protein
VSAPGDQICTEGGNVDIHVRDGLARIHHTDRSHAARRGHHVFHRVDSSEDVRLMDDGDDLRCVVDQREVLPPQAGRHR